MAGACAQAVERLTAGADLTASVNVGDDLPALPAAVEVAAYRIVVEAVTNTVRHARARQCQVSIDHSEAALAIAITDDGAGLRPPDHHGHGLAIMRERAEELGGTVTVTDASPGVTVRARLPAAAAPTAPAPARVAPALT
jgi:signal transduction histidine kinase